MYENLVDEVIGKWQDRTGDSLPFGLTNGQLVELAELAVDTVYKPLTWVSGDKISDDVDRVNGGGLVWSRKFDNFKPTDTWVADISEEELLTEFGPVTESTRHDVHETTGATKQRNKLECYEDVIRETMRILVESGDALREIRSAYDNHRTRITALHARKCSRVADTCKSAVSVLNTLNEGETCVDCQAW